MELLLLVFVSLLTWSGTTFADVNDGVLTAAREPYITTLEQTDDWALLQCKVHEADPKPKVHWQDSDGNILHAKEPQVTEDGYIILQTTVTKTDYYRCNATYEKINHQISAETYVHFKDGVLNAAPEPYVTILEQTKDWSLLQCKVQGAFPKPKLHWQDRAGNILPAKEPQVTERGGSYDIILNITVIKTDYYRCVATQEEINHQISAETYVHFTVSGSSTGWVVAAVLVFLVVVLLGIVAWCFISQRRNKDRGDVVYETSPHNQEEAF